MNLAEKIRERVSTTEIYFKEATIQITVTMGVTQYNGEELAEFLRIVDGALYKGKASGKNKVVEAQKESF